MATGRTESKFIRFILGDSAQTLREIPVNKIGPVQLIYPEVDLTALQDAVRGFLTGLPDFFMDFEGPMDTSAAVANAGSGAVPALSGSHTVLQPLLAVPTAAPIIVSWAIDVGIQKYWSTGDPVFSVTHSSVNGVVLMNYAPYQNGEAMMYKARLRMAPGSIAPAWGTSQVT